jgi:nucleoside phosphorylase
VTSHDTETPRRAVILTALEIEHSAVIRHLSGPLSEHDERGLLFDVGFFQGRHRWAIGVAQGGPGNLGAGIVLERAVTAFHPDVAIFVGVAGGRKDVRHGDVVVAEAVYDYETGKAENADYLPRVKTFAPSFGLVQRARAVARADHWQALIQPAEPARRPAAFVKPIAAGSKMIAGGRSAIAQFLTHNCGDALAVDMESYGFLHGAYVNSDLATLVVRGISDLLDDKTADNDRDWQVPAANNAAAFAFAVLEKLMLDDPPPPDRPSGGGDRFTQTNQPGAGGTVYAYQGTGDQIIQNRTGR